MHNITKTERHYYEATRSHDRGGWCVYLRQVHTASYISGPFTDAKAASLEADHLNEIHKETV